MNLSNIVRLLILLSIPVSICSCKKYLEKKSNQSYSTPETLKDLQALLDRPDFFNRSARLEMVGSDEYYLLPTHWQALGELDKNGHIWHQQVNDIADWSSFYNNVFYANTILDNWTKAAKTSTIEKADEVKGGALVHRAHSFWHIAQLFAPQYDSATANTDLGIVLRLDADFNKPSQRSSVQETYDRIIQDLTDAIEILPVTTLYKTRPNKSAAYALLARVYLQIGNYNKAKEAATNCLNLYNTLIDYNDPGQIDTLMTEPIKNKGDKNPEILLYINDGASVAANPSRAKIDSNFYKSYLAGDLRKAAFFRKVADGTLGFRGSYNGLFSTGQFVGLGSAEVYLIRAECNARLGDANAALQDLNALLIKRFKTGTFSPIINLTPAHALDTILVERKKELLFRGLRWADLKRLNKEPARAITLVRDISGQLYTLPPNDPRYTLLVPDDIMRFTTLVQNPR
jgi:tetratricopeptide (TPR) repeat protein